MDETPVVVATAPNEPLAQLWASVLQEAGIRVLVRSVGPGIGGWGSAAMMEHDLLVLPADLDAARDLLDDDDPV
ncbi:MAG: hypothetical protein IT337_11645 [Thermomicrobiales bacterium]|nr:hypothetical protein [Thermomicrobiales bacterium]